MIYAALRQRVVFERWHEQHLTPGQIHLRYVAMEDGAVWWKVCGCLWQRRFVLEVQVRSKRTNGGVEQVS